MNDHPSISDNIEEVEQINQPHRVRLPGFVSDEDLGLGDAIKRVTYAFGIKPCGGCQKRASALNRWAVINGNGTR